MQADAVIVGAGLFGNTIARALEAEGRKVVVLDDGRPYAASRPSGCLMKPSWFSGLGKAVYEPSLALLERVYGIRDIKFQLPLGPTTTVHWVDHRQPSSTLVTATATAVHPGRVEWAAATLDGDAEVGTIEAPLVVVAAGIWCTKLLECDLKGKQGASFEWVGEIPENRIKPWAPYKQVVAFNIPDQDRIWCGDGSAIKPENWTQERFTQSADRCAAFVGKSRNLGTASVGIRPFAKVKPCLLEEREPGLWLATGGAKNGTIAAGWAAHRILEATS